MRNLNEYDFSKGTGFQDALLNKCLANPSGVPTGPISDDELEFIAAAGTTGADKKCPVPRRPCEFCFYYFYESDGETPQSVPGHQCSLGCTKG